jgi:heat shock protein HslJ
MFDRVGIAAARTGLALTMVLPVSAAAQGEPTSVVYDQSLLLGTIWELSEYAVDGELVDVPVGVEATLQLVDEEVSGSLVEGPASGSGGCNTFSTSFELSEHLLSFADAIARTEILCQGPGQEVEDAYLGTLATINTWSITDGRLELNAPGVMPALVFDDGVLSVAVSDYLGMQAQLEEQADAIEVLTLQVQNLESGEAGAGEATTAPTAPRPRGAVERQFAELGEDPERGLVQWSDRADDEDGYRVFARRIQCVLRQGEVVEEPSPWVRVARLPANAEQYRPRHDEMVSVIEPQNRRVFGSGALYEVGVAAFNEVGQSERVVVDAYITAPEYSCP